MLVRVRDRLGTRVRKATPFSEVPLLVNEVEIYLLKMDAISGLSGSLFSKSKQTRQQAGIFLTFITLVVVQTAYGPEPPSSYVRIERGIAPGGEGGNEGRWDDGGARRASMLVSI